MCFSIAEHQAALVESLICGESHLKVVADAHEKDAAFWQVDGSLAYDFVEKLVVNFFADGANAALASLLLDQLGLKGSFEFL